MGLQETQAPLTDEDRSDGKRQSLLIDVGAVLLVEHAVQLGNLSALVGDDGEIKRGPAGEVVDVLDPAGVGLGVVGGETNELGSVLAHRDRVDLVER